MRVVATVKQHGFTVAKGGLAAVLPIREASRAEEAGEGWPEALQGSPSVPQTLLNCVRSSARAPPLRAAALRWGLPSPTGVEVVGCTHARPEVRRLVQGVSRGLLAHQVRVLRICSSKPSVDVDCFGDGLEAQLVSKNL